MTKDSKSKILALAGISIIALIAYYILTAPDTRSPTEKLSDAANALPNGIDKAARQLEDRTPAEKLKDAANDAKNDLKKTNRQQ